ncbi:uncharacterized protein si:ch1073-126c3.2 isoform X2 [Notolabrus celidotus]|uniref:uncharacterized protein si:ch1073-126c3.2 isoform X2 n=1 Tax=Notolabrus celidotus TaxID=1203425 RepID=UPI00148F79E1|nr:uncharacterized protein si:ch1073-126c3.2 isoform X2 [Notolabrus celidotus]
MGLQGTFTWLCTCTFAVLSLSAPHDDTLLQDCNLQTELVDRLSADLKVAAECSENLPSTLSAQRTASLLLSLKNGTDALHKQLLKECQGAEPNQCPDAEVPHNGGLVCVTVANKRYCKPLCNDGYDFGFIRRSRVYDECSEQTGFKWNTQYIGGNKLAVCNEASIQVSGAATAYFPKYQDCLTTKSSSQQQKSIIELFTLELQNQGIQGQPMHECLVCGAL